MFSFLHVAFQNSASWWSSAIPRSREFSSIYLSCGIVRLLIFGVQLLILWKLFRESVFLSSLSPRALKSAAQDETRRQKE